MSELEDRRIEAEIGALTAKREHELAAARKAILESERLERAIADAKASSDEAQVYYFHGAVGPVSSSACMETLGFWARKNPGSDITIVFNSPGGGVFEGLALYDFIKDIRRRGHTVTTKSLGMAASMGGVLLQAGDERVIGKFARVLIHEVSGGAIGKVSEIEDQLKLSEALQDDLLEILSERSTMTAAQIKRKWKKTDWWLSAEEALELGFVDRIED